ncbi:MAG: CoA pyrophosphatase [Candidatus Nezhaarchaeota archaeon]|nr:CoA pyrophosphatase [Candidatus Nezhaarchaeota archaeon]
MRRLGLSGWLKRELKKLLDPVEVVPPLSPSTAAVIALLSRADGLAVLLIKRRRRAGDPWSGHVALPGGFMLSSDLSLLNAALRELYEEVGVKLRRGDVLGTLPPQASVVKPEVIVVPYVAYLDRPPEVALGPEVEAARWFSLRLLRAGRACVELEDGKEEVDAFLVDGWVVWGLTYRIISELLSRMRPLLDRLAH